MIDWYGRYFHFSSTRPGFLWVPPRARLGQGVCWQSVLRLPVFLEDAEPASCQEIHVRKQCGKRQCQEIRLQCQEIHPAVKKFTLLSRNSRQVGVVETLVSRNRTTVSRNVKKYMSGNSTENASVKKFDCSVKKFTLLSRNSPYEFMHAE